MYNVKFSFSNAFSYRCLKLGLSSTETASYFVFSFASVGVVGVAANVVAAAVVSETFDNV